VDVGPRSAHSVARLGGPCAPRPHVFFQPVGKHGVRQTPRALPTGWKKRKLSHAKEDQALAREMDARAQECAAEKGLLLPSLLTQLKQDNLKDKTRLRVGDECPCKAELLLRLGCCQYAMDTCARVMPRYTSFVYVCVFINTRDPHTFHTHTVGFRVSNHDHFWL
jgi:hypothetical protein